MEEVNRVPVSSIGEQYYCGASEGFICEDRNSCNYSASVSVQIKLMLVHMTEG